MKKAEFDKKFKENKDLQIAVDALFSNRKVEEAKSMVHIGLLTTKDYSSLLNVANKEMTEGYSLIFALPGSFLSEEKPMIIRQELIERNLLDTIVLIPSHWLDNAKEDIALLFLNTVNRQKGIIKFVDVTYDSGSDCPPNGGSVANLIHYDTFPDVGNLPVENDEDQIDLLQNYFNEFIYVAGHYEIRATGYSLAPDKYIKRITSKYRHHLYELSGIWDTAKVKNAKGRIIHVYDLKDSASHYEIEVSSIKASEENGDFYALKGVFILVAKTKELRPTLVDTKGLAIYVPCNEITAISIDKDILLCDYVISELRQPYVALQLDRWRKELLPYIRIHVPNSTDSKSSIELQKESFVQSKFHDVCGSCEHQDLLHLLEELGREEIKNDASVPHKVRNVMESYVLPVLFNNGIRPSKKKSDDKDPNPKTNIRGYSLALQNTGHPEHIKRSFHTISELAPEGTHDNADTPIQKYIREGEAPYLTTSLVYDLINIIVWCKQFENKTI